MEDLQSSAKALAGDWRPWTDGGGADGLEESTTALQMVVDRIRRQEKGVTVAQVYMAVAAALPSTTSVSDVTLDGRSMEVRVRPQWRAAPSPVRSSWIWRSPRPVVRIWTV